MGVPATGKRSHIIIPEMLSPEEPAMRLCIISIMIPVMHRVTIPVPVHHIGNTILTIVERYMTGMVTDMGVMALQLMIVTDMCILPVE